MGASWSEPRCPVGLRPDGISLSTRQKGLLMRIPLMFLASRDRAAESDGSTTSDVGEVTHYNHDYITSRRSRSTLRPISAASQDPWPGFAPFPARVYKSARETPSCYLARWRY